MKKTFIFIISILTITTLMAQAPGGGHRHRQGPPEPPKVEEMVSNLSAIQKKRLEGISENCKKQTAKLQKAKEMYRTRVQIDQVLTEEQLTEFRARCKADRQKHHQDINRKKQDIRPAKKAKRQ